jgi:hypothetical protein
MSKLLIDKLFIRKNTGVWIVSVTHFGIEIIATSEYMKLALETLQQDIDYIEKNLYYSVLRSEAS